MANQKARRGSGRKNSGAGSAVGGAVGTVFNIVLLIVVAMVTYRLAVSAFQYGVRIFGEPAMSEEPGQEVTVTIEDGMDFEGIAQTLYDSGLIRDKTLFRLCPVPFFFFIWCHHSERTMWSLGMIESFHVFEH